jgi:hypothetical protein
MAARPFTPRFEVQGSERRRIWEEFQKDERLKRTYNIKPDELESLKQAALLGNMRTKSDFVFMLNVIRRHRH